MATKTLKQILNANNNHNTIQKGQAYIVKKLNLKLVTENATIVRANKGQTVVIIYSDEYSKKVHTFLTENNFRTLQNNPTDKDQKLICKMLQQCKLRIDKKQIKHLTQNKPPPPTLKAQLKLHKEGTPFRPEINNINAPSFPSNKYTERKSNPQ
jgi:hypothetical protein